MQLNSKTILILIFAIGVYVIFVVISDLSLLYQNFEHLDFRYIPISLGLVFLSYFIRSLRWNMLLKSIKIEIPLKESIKIFFAGLGLGITPGKFGEVIKSHFLKRDYNYSISKTAPVIFIERYYDLVGIVTVSVLSSLFIVGESKTMLVVSVILVISLLIVSRQKKVVLSILKLIEKTPILKKIFSNSLESYDTIISLTSIKSFSKSSILSILSWFLEAVAAFLIFLAFDIPLDFPLVIFIFTILSIIGALSMLPGGLGSTEGGMIGLLILQNVDYTSAFSVVLLVRIVTLWFSVFIGLIALKKIAKNSDTSNNKNS